MKFDPDTTVAEPSPKSEKRDEKSSPSFAIKVTKIDGIEVYHEDEAQDYEFQTDEDDLVADDWTAWSGQVK